MQCSVHKVCDIKVKLSPVHAVKACSGSENIASLLFNFGTNEGE
jgi:hypothetical protein